MHAHRRGVVSQVELEFEELINRCRSLTSPRDDDAHAAYEREHPSASTAAPFLPSQRDRMLSQRRKQIAIGKNTLVYARYESEVPRHERAHDDPHTPTFDAPVPKRTFARRVSEWRRGLHEWAEATAAQEAADAKALIGKEVELHSLSKSMASLNGVTGTVTAWRDVLIGGGGLPGTQRLEVALGSMPAVEVGLTNVRRVTGTM